MEPSSAERAFVTGAAGGMGRRLVGALLERGWSVSAADWDGAALERAKSEDRWPDERVQLERFDVSDFQAWEAALERCKPLKLLINAAGYLFPGPVAQLAPDEVRKHLDVNVKGVIFGTSAAARRMSRGGHVINIGSLAALMPVPGIAIYSASKHAVRAFSLAAADELAPLGIAVSVICPGPVRTAMLAKQAGSPDAALTFANPVLELDDIAAAVLDVIERRPLELCLPPLRALLASLVNAFPRLWRLSLPGLRRQGLKAQSKLTAS